MEDSLRYLDVCGGIRALLEQALHPEAMAGVAAHSNFREDAWGRLQRTGDYVGTLTFGTRDEAEKLAARVRKVHAMLKLDDQRLLLWVHMAMVDAFLDTALRSGLQLSDEEQDRYIEEMVTFALLVGIDENRVPRNRGDLRAYFEEISPELSASDDAKRAALFIALPPLPPLLRFGTPIAPLWGGITSLAAAALPSLGSITVWLANSPRTCRSYRSCAQEHSECASTLATIISRNSPNERSAYAT